MYIYIRIYVCFYVSIYVCMYVPCITLKASLYTVLMSRTALYTAQLHCTQHKCTVHSTTDARFQVSSAV